MNLDIYLDLGNIAGFLALPGIEQLQRETGVEVNWFPIQGIVPRPLRPEPATNPDDPLAGYKHLRWQARYKSDFEELQRDCERCDLDPETAKRSYDGGWTHVGWMYLTESNPELITAFVNAVYSARLSQGETLQEVEAVEKIMLDLDVDTSGFIADLEGWQKRWQSHQEQYLELGIHDSPAFVLGDETFQGRQHFPLIKWRILNAQSNTDIGAAPI